MDLQQPVPQRPAGLKLRKTSSWCNRSQPLARHASERAGEHDRRSTQHGAWLKARAGHSDEADRQARMSRKQGRSSQPDRNAYPDENEKTRQGFAVRHHPCRRDGPAKRSCVARPRGQGYSAVHPQVVVLGRWYVLGMCCHVWGARANGAHFPRFAASPARAGVPETACRRYRRCSGSACCRTADIRGRSRAHPAAEPTMLASR